MIKLKNKALPMGLLATAGVLASGFMNAAQAFVRYDLTGTFGSGGSLSGFFTFDGANYGTWNISSIGGGLSDFTYTSAISALTTSSTVLQLTNGSNNRILNLEFSSSLTGTVGQSVTLTNSNQFLTVSPFTSRTISGSATGVPFDFNFV